MKFNFKKVVPILTGAILLGSTVGLAASVAAQDVTYPTSFANAVVVIGSASTDSAPANDIAADLGKLSAATSLSGENVKIQTSSQNLVLGQNLTNVRTTVIDHGDLPSLLKSVTYQTKGGNSYDYEQKIKLADGLLFTNFRDDDLSTTPVLGVKILKNAPVLNYTLSFLKNAESSVDASNHLPDFEDTDIQILGKSYKVLNAYNGSTTTSGVELDLMGGAVSDILDEGAKQDYVLNGKTYTVEVNFLGDNKAKLVINGEATTSMVAGGTYKLMDGTTVGVRDILFTSKTGEASKVEFTLGAEKLTLKDGQNVQLSDTDVDGLTCKIASSMVNGKVDISSVTLSWTASDKSFIAPNSVLKFPGLESFSVQAGDFTTPSQEMFKVQNNGNAVVELSDWNFKSGAKSFDVLFGDGKNFTRIGGRDTNTVLRTTAASNMIYNLTTDNEFVGTYLSGTACESYLLDAKVKTSSGVNYTDIKDVVSGQYICQDRKDGDDCTIGSLVLHVNHVDYNSDGAVNITATSPFTNTYITGESPFNMLCSEKGLLMMLPTTLAANQPSYPLQFFEADKNGNIAAGKNFNVTVGGWTSDGKVQVSSVSVSTDEIADTQTFVGYVASDLGTKLLLDQNPTQDTVSVEYHGGQSYGNVWIAAPGVVAGSALVVKDTELTVAQKAGDLVVVGGPAVNSIAAQLLGLTFPTYGSDSASGFAPDTAMIKLFTGQITPGKVALLVAGYEAKDTQAAAKALIAEKKFGALTTATSVGVYTA